MQLQTTEETKATGLDRTVTVYYLHHGFLAQAFALEVEGEFFLCKRKQSEKIQFNHSLKMQTEVLLSKN